MKTLNVQVLSGLGSRMRAVIAGIAWARAHGAKVRVCWPWADPSETSKEFPAWFSDLFDSPLEERRLEKPIIYGKEWPQQPLETADGWNVRFCEPEGLGVSQLDLTGWPFCELWRPARLVRDQIDAVAWPQGKVVGVHIRSALAQPSTPAVSWFLARMHAIRRDYAVRFFLSTDAPYVQEQVLREFPGTVHQERTFRYDQLGIARAAADLFLLQRCNWLIGSYNSSFSELVGWMRGGAYLPGWGRPGWMPGGRYEDAQTPPVGLDAALSDVPLTILREQLPASEGSSEA